jgi:DinB superfamily
MHSLKETVAEGLAARVEELSGKVKALAQPLSDEQFWRKPFPFGNSFGHLALHLTGNLNYYIGAQMANTGYVRDRPREFTEANRPGKEEVLKRLEAAVEMTARTIRAQSESDWSMAYTASGEDTVKNRFQMMLRCISHFDHHLGQMQYLCFALMK